jgi:hypothetical protein
VGITALIAGNKLTMEIACTTACHGSGSLRSSAGSHTLLAKFGFTLAAKGVKQVTATLTAKGRKLLAGKKRLIVQATIALSAGKGRPVTFVSAVEMTREEPKARKNAALQAGVLRLAVPQLGS